MLVRYQLGVGSGFVHAVFPEINFESLD